MGSCCAEKIPRRSRTSGRRTTHKGRSGRRSPAGPCEAAQRWSTKARRRRMLHPLQCSPVLGCAAADEDKGAPEAPARTRDGRAARCRGVRRTQPPALSSRLIASVTPNGASAHPSCRLCSCSRSIVLDVVAGGTASITAAHRAGAPSRLGTRPCVAARPGCADQKQHAPPPRCFLPPFLHSIYPQRAFLLSHSALASPERRPCSRLRPLSPPTAAAAPAMSSSSALSNRESEALLKETKAEALKKCDALVRGACVPKTAPGLKSGAC
jgi:hypothetical protein